MSTALNGIPAAQPLTTGRHGQRARGPGAGAHLALSMRRVKPDVARDIAQWFLAAPALGNDSLVSAAYRDLQLQTDRQFAQLTDPDGPFGYTVSWTKHPTPYSTATELIGAVRATGVLEVTAARVERNRLHPALDCGIGGAYDRLRAVHDIVGHVMTGYGFDRDAEYSAWLRQSQLYCGLARWAAGTEFHAEHSVVWTTRQFPEHKAVLLPRSLLKRSSTS
ncbi:hypothetical protein ACSMXN_15490 [Jatrophihabitans sp. DSM 45814]